MLLNRVWHCWGFGCLIECRNLRSEVGSQRSDVRNLKSADKIEKVSFAINSELTFLLFSDLRLPTSAEYCKMFHSNYKLLI